MTDSAYMGSEGTYSECETFTDEDTGALGATEEPGHGATEEPGNGALLLLPGRSVPACAAPTAGGPWGREGGRPRHPCVLGLPGQHSPHGPSEAGLLCCQRASSSLPLQAEMAPLAFALPQGV